MACEQAKTGGEAMNTTSFNWTEDGAGCSVLAVTDDLVLTLVGPDLQHSFRR